MDVVFQEVASVGVAVLPHEETLAMLEALMVLAVVLGAIRPLLGALTALLIILPVALECCAILVPVESESVSHGVLPLALVNVAIGVNQATLPVGMVLFEPPLVYGSIFESLATLALANIGAHHPLPLVLDEFAF